MPSIEKFRISKVRVPKNKIANTKKKSIYEQNQGHLIIQFCIRVDNNMYIKSVQFCTQIF